MEEKRLRKVRKYAGMWVIKLFSTDMKDLNLKELDDVDISQLKKEDTENGDERI